MIKQTRTAFAALAALCIGAATASAHEMKWQPGESRQVGYGHCAKGPCMKRTSWAASKPHCHAGSRVVIEQYPRGTKSRR